ncbi:MAG: ribosome biogenesis GTP-binding protein YihA/YsxC [Bacillota bacterium]
MTPAKPVNSRMREPREKKKAATKPDDFTVPRSPAATPLAASFSRIAFQSSVHDLRELPREGVAEIAFAGRSNAGKSSAINSLANRRRLAFVSKTPGRTQLINFFSLGDAALLVDLPGYGYAGVPGPVREHWESLVGGYLAGRASLALLVVVMDIRHPLGSLDRRLLAWLPRSRPVHVLLTKSDKLARSAAARTLAQVRRELADAAPHASVQAFSSLKREGIGEAVERIAQAIDDFARAKNKSPG